MNYKRTLGPDPKSKSNVEAEKGETVLTNMSRGLNNIIEFYEIAGKKHSEGGTPLNLPTDDLGQGASFVFSDKLKITEPAVLELFNVKKKTATYADVSKKHLDIINKSKDLLLNPGVDKIAKKSAELNIETSVMLLNKLKLLQESSKGFENGLPSGTESYLKEMGIDPQSFLNPSEEMQEASSTAQTKALGGIVRKNKMLFMSDGGNVSSQFGDKDPNARTQYTYIKEVLGKNEGFKKALFEEYKKISKDPSYYGKGYAGQLNNPDAFGKFEIKSPEEAYQAYLKMQERNLIFKSNGYNVSQTANDPSQNKEVPLWAKQHNVPISNMDDIAKEQIAYWAFENLSKNRDAYNDELKTVLQPFSATQFGSNDDRFKGAPSTITLADGAYTNTSAGQISNFKAPPIEQKENGKLTFPTVEKQIDSPNPDPTKVSGLEPQQTQLENPLGYRSQDIRNLNRALESRAGIKRYDPFSVTPEMKGLDVAYYSPERQIAAIMEQVNSAEDISKAFGDAQGATSGALALSGSAFDATADAISNYADKNVGLFNSVSTANTEIHNRQNAMEADAKNQLYADNVDMDEKFRRGVEMAKDKIVLMKNAAETNMAQRYNANLMTEQFKTDPYSGLTYFTNGKDLVPTSASQKDAADELNEFMKKVPNLDPNVAAKVFMGVKSGKFEIEPLQQVTPNQ
jgi:hypothetical protein